jgi:capsule polysaccharide export protein KpsE/RkpR
LANTFVEELGKTTVRLNLTRVGTEKVFLEKRLEIVKADLKKAEDELKAFAQQNKIVQVDSQAKVSIEGIDRLKAEIASREVQLSVLRTYQTDESAEVKSLQTGVRKLQQEISKLSGSSSGGEGIPSIGAVPGGGLEYARTMRDMKFQEAIFEQLPKQYEMAKLNEAKDSSSIQVLDSAVPPNQKSKQSEQ